VEKDIDFQIVCVGVGVGVGVGGGEWLCLYCSFRVLSVKNWRRKLTKFSNLFFRYLHYNTGSSKKMNGI